MVNNRWLSRFILAGVAGLAGSGLCTAGDGFHHRGHAAGCGCRPHASEGIYTRATVEHSYSAALAVPTCCGVGGGLAQVGNLYGLEGAYGGFSPAAHGGHPAPGSFLSGYEGLPNMDGGGIHYRYPYHSYRRPWAHPGTPSTNVTIVW